MAGLTLKIYSYRGNNVYCRWLGEYQYEVLIAYKGGIYAHQLHLLKPRRNERRNTLEERHRGAETELQVVASILIDNLIKENTFKKVAVQKIKNIINRIKSYARKTTKIVWNSREGERIS